MRSVEMAYTRISGFGGEPYFTGMPGIILGIIYVSFSVPVGIVQRSARDKGVMPVSQLKAASARFPEFTDCFLGGMEDWKNEVTPRARTFTSCRTRATFIRDAIVARARQKFFGSKGIGFEDRHGMFCVVVEHEALVRLKKFNRKLEPQNILTQNVTDFFSDNLFGFPVFLTRVVIGYRLNHEQTEIQSIDVTVYSGNRIVDVQNLYDAGDAAGGGVFEGDGGGGGGDIPPTLPMPAVANRQRVKPKDGREVEGHGRGEDDRE